MAAQENLSETLPRGLNEAKTAASLKSLKAISESRSFPEKAVLPSRASPLSAGYDLSSAAEVTVPARGKALVPTNLSIGIPEGTYAGIEPRSGLALKNSMEVGAGVIDGGYRGPVGVIQFNHSDVDFQVKHGDGICPVYTSKRL